MKNAGLGVREGVLHENGLETPSRTVETPSRAVEFIEVPFAVPDGTARSRVDLFLSRRLMGYSRARVQGMIETGRVWVRGRAAKPSTPVAAGGRVVVRFPWRPDPPSAHESLEVLFEDDAVLAVNKPGDVLTHPTDKTTRASATWILSRQFPALKPCLIHRLDRETSGVLLFGKTRAAARRLAPQFEDREVRKEYWAIVRGRFGSEPRVVDLPLDYGRHAIRLRQEVCGHGRPARTEVRPLASGAAASLVAAVPRTGRLHQIRVHLASLGFPVLGDKLYTGDGEAYLKAARGGLGPEDLAGLGAPRQMLHARSLELAHPFTREPLRLEAPVPEDFARCLALFGLAVP